MGLLVTDSSEVLELSGASVGRLLRKMGLSPQKPLNRAYQRDSSKIADWLEKGFPEIKKLAKKERATINFGDEAGVRSDCHSETIRAPVGKAPVIEATGARFGLGHLRLFIFPLYSPHLNPDEWVWNWLKRYKPGRTTVSGPEHLKKMVKRFMLQLQRMPKIIKWLFSRSKFGVYRSVVDRCPNTYVSIGKW